MITTKPILHAFELFSPGCECSHCKSYCKAEKVAAEIDAKINRLVEVAAFLAESIENPRMKTQQEALAAWKDLNQ